MLAFFCSFGTADLFCTPTKCKHGHQFPIDKKNLRDQYNNAPMSQRNDNRVLHAFARAIRPIVRLLVRNSIDCTAITEVVKSVFVEVTANDYGLHGRETSLSRVSAITNLNRREVRRIKDNLDKGEVVGKIKPIAVDTVLDVWHTLPAYLGDDGSPLELATQGASPSLTSLVKLAGRDTPAGAIKTELLRLGLVQVLNNGRLKPIARRAPMIDDEHDLALAFEDGLLPAAECIVHNVVYKGADQQWPYCIISADADTAADLPVIRQTSLYAINRFCDELPAAFNALTPADLAVGHSNNSRSVRVGIFHYEVNSDGDTVAIATQ